MRHRPLGLAVGLFLLTAVPALAQVTFTITPSAAPLGTRFVTTVEGLQPNTEYQFLLIDPSGREFPNPFRTALAGRFSDSWNADPGDPLGVYTVRVVTADGQQVVASATFTVTDPQAPAAAPQGGPAADHPGRERPATLPAAGAAGSALRVLGPVGLALAGAGVALRRRGSSR